MDPSNVINEISALPSKFEEIQSIRRMFNVDEYVLFEFYETSDLTHQFEFDTFPRNDFFNTRLCTDSCTNLVSYYGQDVASNVQSFKNESGWASIVGQEPPQSKVLGRISKPFVQVVDYDDSNNERAFDIYPRYIPETKTLDLSLKAGEFDLRILSFLNQGIGDTPLDAKIHINPDNSIFEQWNQTFPYQGTDDDASEEEDYMSIEFNLDVSASDDGLKFMLLENEEIQAQYVDGSVIISRTIINEDYDEIVITDGLLSQPDTLNLKVLNLLAKVSDVISGIENFFSDGGNYFFKLNLGSDFSIIDFYRNTVDNIQGQFTTKTNPSAGIFVRDMTVMRANQNLYVFSEWRMVIRLKLHLISLLSVIDLEEVVSAMTLN